MATGEEIKQKNERRYIISSVFVSVLLGLAFQEMVPPVRDSIRASGFTIGTTVFFLVFFATSMRFFIGNQLHLVSDSLLKMKGLVWFYDLIWIIIQTTLLIFLGGLTSVESSRAARVSFVTLLSLLYLVDVFWIISQWLMGTLFPKDWKRDFIPWTWAILNILLVVGMAAVGYLTGDLYSRIALVSICIINIVAFAIDVLLSDYHDLI